MVREIVIRAMWIGLVCLPMSASACGIVSKGGKVTISTEDSLIVYNPSTRREDFIRRMNFSTSKEPFGFLVPVPSMPTLSAVSANAFERLSTYDPALGPLPTIELHDNSHFSGGGTKPAVQVIHQQYVAGYEAAILRSDTGGALQEWLKKQEFPVQENITTWAQHYLDRGYGFVAFKFTPEAKEGKQVVRPKPVRISFLTDMPFFPYREPKGADVAASRSWKVYFASVNPGFAKLEDGTPFSRGRSENALALSLKETQAFAAAFGLGRDSMQGTEVLTRFIVDSSESRPDSDVLFAAVPWESHKVGKIPLSGTLHYPTWNSLR